MFFYKKKRAQILYRFCCARVAELPSRSTTEILSALNVRFNLTLDFWKRQGAQQLS